MLSTALKGYITSPNLDLPGQLNPYPLPTDCTWRIYVPDNLVDYKASINSSINVVLENYMNSHQENYNDVIKEKEAAVIILIWKWCCLKCL